MTVFQALILGVVQGLTEFLPISSSGHLIFIPKIFGWADQGLAFDVVVHLGTLVAVVVFFWRRLLSLFKGCRLGWYILLSSIPAGVAGLLFGDWIEANTRSAAVVAWSLIGWGMVLGVADYVSRKHGNTENTKTRKHLSDISWREVLVISCAQAIALIPGTSRSGITMTAGLFSRLDKTSAAEFSFLMLIPVTIMAGSYKAWQLLNGNLAIEQFNNLAVGGAAAAASGLIAIWGLMKIIQRWNFLPFVVYRVVAGVAILLYLR